MGRAAVRASAAWRPAIVLIAGVDPPKRPPAPPGWWPRLLGQRPGPTEKPNPPFWFVVVHLQLFAQKSRFVLGRLGCLLPWPPAPIPILPEGPKKCEKLVDGVASAGKNASDESPAAKFCLWTSDFVPIQLFHARGGRFRANQEKRVDVGVRRAINSGGRDGERKAVVALLRLQLNVVGADNRRATRR